VIASMTVSNFVNIYHVLTILHQLICRGLLILGCSVITLHPKIFSVKSEEVCLHLCFCKLGYSKNCDCILAKFCCGLDSVPVGSDKIL